MGAQAAHALAQRRDAARLVHGAEINKQCTRRRNRAFGRRIRKSELAGRRAPGRAIQHQAGKLGLQDFRPVMRAQATLDRGCPKPDGDAGRLAPGAAGALIGGGAADALRRQSGQTAGRIKAGAAAKTAIDDDAHARHGERGFGDRGGQHHAPALRRPQRQILHRRRQVAMQRQHQGIKPFQRCFCAADFAHARQEGQDVARRFRQCGANGARHRLRQIARIGDIARGMANSHRIHAPGAFHEGRVHGGAKTRTIQGRGHGQQPQVGPQHRLRIQAQRQRQVGFQRTLMDFIQDDGGNTIQTGIAQQAAHQQARGHHFDARGGGHGAFQPRAEADRLPHRLADQACHAGGCGTGRQPARFEHQDAACVHGRSIQQRERHGGRLARTRRRDQYRVGTRTQHVKQARNAFRDGKVRHGETGR